MPNHCSNDLWISGPRQAVEECLAGINGQKQERPLDFNRIIPMPDGYQDLVSGSHERVHTVLFGTLPGLDGEASSIFWNHFIDGVEPVRESEVDGRYSELARRHLAEFCRNTNMTPREAEALALRYEANLRQHGHKTWYGWCLANWGTKWNAYGQSGVEMTALARTVKAKITFDTAWSPPVPVITRLASMFPRVTVILRYYECGMAFQGVFKAKGDRIVHDSQCAYRGNRGG